MPSTSISLGISALVSLGVGYVAIISPFEFVGMPAAVLCMAFVGTAAGLIAFPPKGGRGRLFGYAFAYTSVSAGLAIFVGRLPGLGFLADIAPVTALLLAFFAGSIVPALYESTGEAIKARIRKLGGGDP